MRLKRLEISGFKSFAKPAVLEFPSDITAIVGPNGSGKSNIVEAIRWVLGEQSMKILRGKRGEDLIYNGSSRIPRMGKASVELLFDNRDGRIPIDFDDVSLARKIFRDGLNEYYINNSQVRLKDIVEIIARMGLGDTKHNIISQGEVDRMLLSSPKERRGMLEEALGLRVYQLKKSESEKKIAATDENMKRVESLIREISPHLRFLKLQADKAEARETVQNELKNFQKIYFTMEEKEILRQKNNLAANRTPLENAISETNKEISEITRKIQEEEKRADAEKSFGDKEKNLLSLESKRRELERELGRLEGRLEMERQKSAEPQIRLIDTSYIRSKISDFIKDISILLEEEDRVDGFRESLRLLKKDLEELSETIEKGRVEEKAPGANNIFPELEKEISSVQLKIRSISFEIEKEEEMLRSARVSFRAAQSKIREYEKALRAAEETKRDLELKLQRFDFDREKIFLREQEFSRDLAEAGFEGSNFRVETLDGYNETPLDEIRKKIERLKGKLEEIGGIDSGVVKEYKETKARHEFLSKELDDLKNASKSLRELIKELEKHIKDDFERGFAKIKKEFDNYFRLIFGGGSAKLKAVDYKQKNLFESPDENDFDEEREEGEEGIEIDVTLPRKRIKGLAMLSGGERALTSIALLFAITAVNPPPFLVLDETDAALDEANSRKYAAILKELAKKTQLILVTHNRETMSSAGILYGVTMEDDGVSKLLSLRLEEAEAYTNR